MSLWSLYLITTAVNFRDDTGPIAFILIVVALLGGAFVLIGNVIPEKEWADYDKNNGAENKKSVMVPANRAFKIVISIFVVLFILRTAIPTEKQMYMIAGGYYVTNVKDINKLPENAVKAANMWLEKFADAAEPKGGKRVKAD